MLGQPIILFNRWAGPSWPHAGPIVLLKPIGVRYGPSSESPRRPHISWLRPTRWDPRNNVGRAERGPAMANLRQFICLCDSPTRLFKKLISLLVTHHLSIFGVFHSSLLLMKIAPSHYKNPTVPNHYYFLRAHPKQQNILN